MHALVNVCVPRLVYCRMEYLISLCLQVLDFSDGLSWDLGNGVPMGHPVNRKRHRYCRTGFGGSYIGSARRRLGRGGR